MCALPKEGIPGLWKAFLRCKAGQTLFASEIYRRTRRLEKDSDGP